jgi:hypothetical protein
MTDPTSQHLYLMQNEFGCIKIGRSVDPWLRARKLPQTEHCRIELIAAFEGRGEEEELVHLELVEYRLLGEWFDGADLARRAINQLFEIDDSEWKFAYDPEGTARWLDHLCVVRRTSYIRKALTRSIGLLRAAKQGSWVYDGDIFRCRFLAAHGENPVYGPEKRDGEVVCVWLHDEKRELVPPYTASVEQALLAWPEDLRPGKWEGTAIECCIAALVAIRQSLPKTPRRSEAR